MKRIADIVDNLLSQHRWEETFDSYGCPSRVHIAIKQLLLCDDNSKICEIYWNIENVVVVQRQVYESALPCLGVMLFALAKCELLLFVKSAIYSIMFEVVAGYPDITVIGRGNGDIVEKCRALVSRAGFLIIHEVENGSLDNDYAVGILNCVGWSSDEINKALYL